MPIGFFLERGIMLTELEKKNIEAVTMNVLLDAYMVKNTHDWQDYEKGKRIVQASNTFTPEGWEIACKVIAEYTGV